MHWRNLLGGFCFATLVFVNGMVDGGDCSCNNFLDLTDELDERDFEAVTEYIDSKRCFNLNQKMYNLKISGDVRFEWQHLTEKVNGHPRRGDDAVDCTFPLPQGVESNAAATTSSNAPSAPQVGHNDFDVELNLVFDYHCDRAWAVGQLQFDNPVGTHEHKKKCGNPEEIAPGRVNPCNRFDNHACHGSGRSDCISLRKAYMGYNVCADGCSRLDIELGRRRLYDVFDSKIQFLSLFDGGLAHYLTKLQQSDLYLKLAAFVVDERANHFGWVGEVGFLDIANRGIDLKYSFIDWEKHGQNRCKVSHPRGWQFKNSQLTFAYHVDPEMVCTPAKLYGAVLVNHAAEKRPITLNKRENLGFYIGCMVGEVCGQGDWAVDVCYQYVQPQAVSDSDSSGIGRGNVYDETFTMASDPRDARGNTNYKGFRIDALYAIFDNFSINAQFQCSRAIEKNIGGPVAYSKLKLEAIYAF